MSEKKYKQVMDEFDNDLGFEKVLSKLVVNWPWFIVSVLICFSIAYYIAKVKTPLYVVHTQVVVNDPKKGSGQDQMLGMLGNMTGSAVETEAGVLRTRFLMERVVRDLKLNIAYFNSDNISKRELYAAPFVVDIVQPVDTVKTTPFNISFLNGGKIELTSDVLDTTVFYSRPFKVPGVGLIQILKGPAAPPAQSSYAFTISSVDKTVERLSSQMEVLVPNKTSSIVDITLNYPVPQKGEDILNKLIQIYVQTNLDDKNKIADSTYAFIQNRLSYLGGELGSLEGNIQSFRQKNQITQMSEQSSLLIANSGQFMNDLAKVETQLSVLSSIQDYLEKNVKGDRVVPSSLVITGPMFTSLVEKYNNLLLERTRRLLSVTETNPVIVNLDQQIASTRGDMLASLSSSKSSLNITRNDLLRRIRSVDVEVQNVPEKERNYLELARQQKIKEELFVYLMQKGEETAISKTYNTPNLQNIDPPKSGTSPVSPRKSVYYFVGIFIGLILPAAWIYLKFLLNNKVDSKDDVTQKTTVSIVGEISHNSQPDNLVVGNQSRSAIAEQFRALRTNLGFYLKGPSENVILLTSSMSGEGKSFISINLGSVLALSGKKVLLMELDLRKPGLSGKLNIANNVGFTNFIVDETLTADDIIKPLSLHKNMFIISSGALPPNPAELLMSSRAASLFADLKERFDFIIIDVPPVGVVTDAQLLTEYADFCIYVVRQNYTLKSQLGIVEDMKRNDRMKRLGIVINDIKIQKGSGYGYGYNYGSYGDEPGGSSLMDKVKSLFGRSV